jgi:hypothetical protein
MFDTEFDDPETLGLPSRFANRDYAAGVRDGVDLQRARQLRSLWMHYFLAGISGTCGGAVGFLLCRLFVHFGGHP